MPVIVKYTKNDNNYIISINNKVSNADENEMNFLRKNKSFACMTNEYIRKKLIKQQLTVKLISVIETNQYKYEGEVLKGKRHGSGKTVYKSGEIYDGEWEEDEMIFGIKLYPNGELYEGECKGYSQHGYGVFRCKNGEKFEGVYYNNHKARGIMTYANGDVYEGEFNNENKKQGQGMMTYSNGDIYEGRWLDDVKHGFGILTLVKPDDKGYQYYAGNWQKGKMIDEIIASVNPMVIIKN